MDPLQVHLRHEGEGAPRVARPVQALGGTVRPAPAAAAAAAVRVCGGAGAALRHVALPRRALEPHRAALDAAAAALMLTVAAEPRARMAGARGRPARVLGGPKPPGAAARWARRSADNTELAALPAAADWPILKYL